MSRVVFDARTLSAPRSGIGRYLEGLLTALRASAPEHEYHLLTNRKLLPGTGLHGQVISSWMPKQLWESVALPREARRMKADVLHLPHEGFPGRDRRLRRVVTVHDLIPFHFSKRYMRNVAHDAWYRARLRAVKRYADVVITISHATATELSGLLGISRDRLRVVQIPVDPRFTRVAGASVLVDDRFGLESDGYFLAVGSADPRKNLVTVLQAHARYVEVAAFPRRLALFGHTWRGQSIEEIVAEHGAAGLVCVVGAVTDEELVALYNCARAMVFPSTYEGYGLPVMEAMACGTAVICTAGGAVGEAAGSAAILVDPMDVAQLAHAFEAIAGDDAERTRLSEMGFEWSRRFTWQDAAAAVLDAYENA